MATDYVKDCCAAHTDLNILYSIIAILEGGCVSSKMDITKSKIIKLCKSEAQNRLREYDYMRFKLSSQTTEQTGE